MPSRSISMLALMFLLSLTGCLKPSGGRAAPTGGQRPAGCSKRPALDLLAEPRGTWVEVKEVLTRSCKGCHETFDQYATAKREIVDIVRTTKLRPSDEDFMPQGSSKQLAERDLEILKRWKSNGMPKEGTGDSDEEKDRDDDDRNEPDDDADVTGDSGVSCRSA